MNQHQIHKYNSSVSHSRTSHRQPPRSSERTTHSWKNTVVNSCLAILGLWSSIVGHAQENTTTLDATYATTGKTEEVRLCNRGYIEHAKQIYEVSARHCETGLTGNSAVNKDDIVYKKVSSSPTGYRVMNILDRDTVENGELDNKEVTVRLCVYNIEGETGRNQYCKPFTSTARYDANRQMYYVEIPTATKRWYSENVSEFCRHKMKSSSGSPVEWQGKFVGVISWIGINPFSTTAASGYKPFEGRLYFAPAKTNLKSYSI